MKKNFKENLAPAMQFISQSKDVSANEQKETVFETKSRRMQLLIKPSLYEKVSIAARLKGVSVNEFIGTVLESYVN